jgi:retron-type reverse transcriptase
MKGVLEDKELKPTFLEFSQGGVISPLRANIYLNYLDTIWAKQYADLSTSVRYTDDLVLINTWMRDIMN